MDGMPSLEILYFKLWKSDALGFKFRQGRCESREIGLIGQNDYIAIAAKLRCAVQHAGLPAHKQVAYPVA